MPKCTWTGCKDTATVERASMDGEVWARLCADHDAELSAAIASMRPPAILSAWVKAQGGAKVAVRRAFRS